MKKQKKLQEQVQRLSMDISLPDDLVAISRLFAKAGKDFYLVGGAVRDALMGKTPKDLDVATNALPDEVEKILRTVPGNKILEIGKAFGIVKVITPEGNEYEIATFRQDIGKGRRPDAVAFTTIENDVMRRDLTINALFYDINRKEVVDFVGGIQDIRKGIVRTVGSPQERFDEDRLRILRALRFAGRFGTELDQGTADAIQQDNSLAGVSGERIRDEFLKGIKSAKSVKHFLGLVSQFDLWGQIFPGLKVDQSFEEVRDPVVQIALLLRDNDFKSVERQLNKAKYSAEEARQVSFLIAFQALDANNAYKMKKLYRNSGLTDEQIQIFGKFCGAPNKVLIKTFMEYEPSVSGTDLQSKGFKQGVELGREIERLEKEAFLAILKQM